MDETYLINFYKSLKVLHVGRNNFASCINQILHQLINQPIHQPTESYIIKIFNFANEVLPRAMYFKKSFESIVVIKRKAHIYNLFGSRSINQAWIFNNYSQQIIFHLNQFGNVTEFIIPPLSRLWFLSCCICHWRDG